MAWGGAGGGEDEALLRSTFCSSLAPRLKWESRAQTCEATQSQANNLLTSLEPGMIREVGCSQQSAV